MTDPTARELITDLLALTGIGDRGLTPDVMERLAQTAERARAYLAQPEPVGPTDEELLVWAHYYGIDYVDAHRPSELDAEKAPVRSDELCIFARAAIAVDRARWGRPAIKPVPVSERPWEREGWCDAEGKCWWGRPWEELYNSDWSLATRAEVEEFCDCYPPVVSLPHWALPVPQQEATDGP